MDVTILFENTKPEGTGYIVDNGLSMLVEKDGGRVLYDTGRNDGLLHNAAALGVDLVDVDAVVISHGHADHTGGLLSFLQVNSCAPVYLKREALIPLYAKTPQMEMNVTTDPRIVAEHGDRLNFAGQLVEIGYGLYVIPVISRTYPLPTGNKILFSGENGRVVNDRFEHELFMVAKEGDGLVVFTGCGHLGLQNIVSTAKVAFPGCEIKAVIGGFHYEAPGIRDSQEPGENIEAAARWALQEGIGKIYTGHCTGTRGYSIMKPFLRDRMERFTTGMKIRF
ncbi:MAG TPA: MBL fold metallo-hydrolase [Methanocella sp.]|nr:MBL fold metallo-hydrolase [Methanocella sp.]